MLLNGRDLHSATKIGKTIKKDVVEKVDPAAMEKLNWLIHLKHIRGEIGDCKSLINSEIARSQGKNEYVFFKQGIILKEEGNIQEALETFQKCLKLNQPNGIIFKEVAKCLYEMRRFRLALNAYLEAERLSKNADWQLCYFIAQVYMKLKNMEKAKEYAHKSVKIGKQEIAYAMLMKILLSESDIRSAIAVANAAVESCPDSVELLTESGLLFLKTGQSQHAFERLSQALALEQTCSKALLGIGSITHAISCIKRGLWVAPLNWKILFNLGLVHLATSQPASGFNFACAAVNLRPDVGECFALLGYTLFELKDFKNALRAMKQACVLMPTDVAIVANVAFLLEMIGLFEESKNYRQKFKVLAEEGQNVTNEVALIIGTAGGIGVNLVEMVRSFLSLRPPHTPQCRFFIFFKKGYIDTSKGNKKIVAQHILGSRIAEEACQPECESNRSTAQYITGRPSYYHRDHHHQQHQPLVVL